LPKIEKQKVIQKLQQKTSKNTKIDEGIPLFSVNKNYGGFQSHCGKEQKSNLYCKQKIITKVTAGQSLQRAVTFFVIN
jgi:hypothetical protein